MRQATKKWKMAGKIKDLSAVCDLRDIKKNMLLCNNGIHSGINGILVIGNLNFI